MGIHMNVFRILADLSHTASKCILIWAIHSNSSAEGVSLLTQLLYIVVFSSRYLDLFFYPPFWNWWNFFLKIFYLASSAYIVFLMMRMFPRTREKEYSWKLATWSLAGCIICAPFITLVFKGWTESTFFEVIYTFSLELEAFCVLPQLLLLRQTSVPTVLDSFYLVTLGSYRFFYILNWILKASTGGKHHAVDPISAIFGVIQTAFYIDFAWVYWTRQRVKLRGGGLVDSEDLTKSFIVRRFIGNRGAAADDASEDGDEEAGLAQQEDGVIHSPQPRRAAKWGGRGISVSADDTLLEHDRRHDNGMADPEQFEDDDDDDVDDPLPSASASKSHGSKSKSSDHKSTDGSDDDSNEGVGSSAGEWQENSGK